MGVLSYEHFSFRITSPWLSIPGRATLALVGFYRILVHEPAIAPEGLGVESAIPTDWICAVTGVIGVINILLAWIKGADLRR